MMKKKNSMTNEKKFKRKEKKRNTEREREWGKERVKERESEGKREWGRGEKLCEKWWKEK